MTPKEVVRTFWERVDARDWDGVRELLAPNVVVEWTETNERFVGPDDVVSVNAEYPEGWSIRVRSLLADGDTVVSDVEVPHGDLGTFRVAAFTDVVDGRIARSLEYWIQVGGSDPPAWRRRFSRPATSSPLRSQDRRGQVPPDA